MNGAPEHKSKTHPCKVSSKNDRRASAVVAPTTKTVIVRGALKAIFETNLIKACTHMADLFSKRFW
jgi:hypothetical protein